MSGGSRSRRWLRRGFTVLDKRQSKLDGCAAVENQIQALLRGEDRDDYPKALRQRRTRIDYAALPPELAQKVSARSNAELLRGSALPLKETPGPFFGRADPTRVTPQWVWWTLGGWWCSGILLSPLVAMLSDPLSIALFFSPVPVTAAAAVTIRRWQKGSPFTYTRAEAKLVWKSTTTVSFDIPWSRHFRDHYAIQVVAAKTLAAIESSPAWRSERCDLDRIQIDLAEEMFQINLSCENLAKLAKVISEAEPTATTGSTSAARAALEDKLTEYEALYREARAAVVRRVEALYTYQQRLAGIEVLLSDLAKAAELAARTDDFSEAFTAIVRDTAAAERTEALAVDLEILQERLEAELAFISGNVIHDPGLATPLAMRPQIEHS